MSLLARDDAPSTHDTRGTFTFGERLGLVFIAQMGCISALLVGSLLLLIIFKAVRRWRIRRMHWPSEVHMYFISLLVAEYIQAWGAIFDIKWVYYAGVLEGHYCTAQGLFKQMGDVGVALSSLAIACQTFAVIVLHWPSSRSPHLALFVIACIWIFISLITGIPWALHHNHDAPYYGNTKWWCWIPRQHYLALGISLEYAWMWLAAVGSFILYIPVAVVVYRKRVKSYYHDDESSTSSIEDDRNQQIALKMILYPVIYLITVTPISVVRFIEFGQPSSSDIPAFEAIAAAGVIFASSGVFNVLLFAYTRPSLLPINSRDDGRDALQSSQLATRKTYTTGTETKSNFRPRPASWDEEDYRPFSIATRSDNDHRLPMVITDVEADK